MLGLAAIERADASGRDPVKLTRTSIQQYVDNLRNMGMGIAQIEELKRTGELTQSIRLTAPATSFVLARNVAADQRIVRGQELYRLADLSRIWILADLFEHESPYVRAGQRVRVLYRGRTCGMEVDTATADYKSEYGGKTYYFCNSRCKKAFDQEPQKYLNKSGDAGD